MRRTFSEVSDLETEATRPPCPPTGALQLLLETRLYGLMVLCESARTCGPFTRGSRAAHRFLLPHCSHTVVRAARHRLATIRCEDVPDFHHTQKGERRCGNAWTASFVCSLMSKSGVVSNSSPLGHVDARDVPVPTLPYSGRGETKLLV